MGLQIIRGRRGDEKSMGDRRKSFHVLESGARTSEVSVPVTAHTAG